MNADQLYNTTMDPKNRMLLQININDILQAEQQISLLMGEDTCVRKA